MDEPFSALDVETRSRLYVELAELEDLRRKTVLLVTHDPSEAFRLCDRVAVIERGRVLQLGTPAELRAAPATVFVARLVEHAEGGDLS
jgi:osmoprotectant transport system ATP-binding protein